MPIKCPQLTQLLQYLACAYLNWDQLSTMTCHERRLCVDSFICVKVRSKYDTCRVHKCLLSKTNLIQTFLELQPPKWEIQRLLVTATVPQHRQSPASRARSFFVFFPPILSNDVVAFSKLSSSFRYLTSEHRRLEIILDPYHKIEGVQKSVHS